MQIFIVVGVILFAGLFFLMSLPIQEEWLQSEADTQKPDTVIK